MDKHNIFSLLLGFCFLVFTVDYNKEWLGLESDQKKLLKYELHSARYQLTPLAVAGDPKAQHELGLLFQRFNIFSVSNRKFGVPISHISFSPDIWFESAAKQGYVPSQFALGEMYYKGDSEPRQNYARAMKWYRLAAEQGDEVSQYMIGQMYYEGHGVGQDHAEALKWYRLAAEQGHIKAQEMVDQLTQ